MMKIVKELLKNKVSEVWNVSPDTHVFEALE